MLWHHLLADGWKSAAAAMGTPLVNFEVLLPDGGAVFMGVERASGVSKDGEWIAEVR